MGRLQKTYYSAEALGVKRSYYSSLSEKGQRHYLGQEYLSLGEGSQRYLSLVFGCSRDTIRKGYKEILIPNFQGDYGQQRSKGGGRKKKK